MLVKKLSISIESIAWIRYIRPHGDISDEDIPKILKEAGKFIRVSYELRTLEAKRDEYHNPPPPYNNSINQKLKADI
jgi:hypothetical protein